MTISSKFPSEHVIIHFGENVTKGQGVIAVKTLRRPPLDVGAAARMPLTQLSNLPDEPGVYLAIDDGNRIWYVGIADSIRERLVNHDRMDDFKGSGVTAIAWRSEENTQSRRCLERDLIEYCHPPLNTQHNFQKLPAVDLGLTPDEEIERFLRLRVQLKLVELELESLKPNIITRCQQAGSRIEHRLGIIYPQAYKSAVLATN